MASLSPEVKSLLDRPNFAHLATLMADGSPHATPIWVGREGERIVICTSDGSLNRGSRCRLWTSKIPTRKCKSADAWWNAAPIRS
jgi:nitroimidazol reductase NimA-like FMN-containing flavoprotein (pyridoxamine 5'-phosphate oxidase superfamily)